VLQRKASTHPDGLSKDRTEGHQAHDHGSQKPRRCMWIVPDDSAVTDSDRKDIQLKETDGMLSQALDVTLQVRYTNKYGSMSPGECKRLQKARAILAAFAGKRQEALKRGMCCVCVGCVCAVCVCMCVVYVLYIQGHV
jgi:hypothetical protein